MVSSHWGRRLGWGKGPGIHLKAAVRHRLAPGAQGRRSRPPRSLRLAPDPNFRRFILSLLKPSDDERGDPAPGSRRLLAGLRAHARPPLARAGGRTEGRKAEGRKAGRFGKEEESGKSNGGSWELGELAGSGTEGSGGAKQTRSSRRWADADRVDANAKSEREDANAKIDRRRAGDAIAGAKRSVARLRFLVRHRSPHRAEPASASDPELRPGKHQAADDCPRLARRVSTCRLSQSI